MASLYYLCLFVIFTLLNQSVAVQRYLPRTGGLQENDRQSLIENYFDLGFQYSEILAFLSGLHGIQLSLRQLKRILQTLGLRRRRGHASVQELTNAIEQKLAGSGSGLGYRLMHQRLRVENGLVASRKTVRLILKHLDPEGIGLRSRRRLRRRQYYAKGPNFIWHVDGYDKLKPFGFCVHGAIDGFSRRIMWLEVGPSNNDPKITVKYFIDCVREVGGVPKFIRSDCGTENIYIAGVQRFLRMDSVDIIAGGQSFLYGKSVSNQRIEAWWSFLRRSYSDWWITFFKDMRDSGIYNDSNPLQAECLKFCFMHLIQDELNNVAKHWNLHRIRPSNNRDSPPGKPDVLYFLPERFDTRDFKTDVDAGDIDIAEENYAEVRPVMGCDDSFAELAQMVMEDHGYQMPGNARDAYSLYIGLLYHINAI